jgi:stress-induced morphogen
MLVRFIKLASNLTKPSSVLQSNLFLLKPKLVKIETRTFSLAATRLSNENSNGSKEKSDDEKKLITLLKAKFPKAKEIDVIDISGGCGSMYAIYVETIEFKNMRTVKQHQLINETLKNEIKSMHGLRIQTVIPEK